MEVIKLKRLKKTLKISLNLKDHTGQSTLEFVLTIPVLVLVILAVSQFGILIYQKNILTQAAREGARIVATTDSNEIANSAIKKICRELKRDNLSVSIIPGDPGQRKTGDYVEVDIGYRSTGFADVIERLIGKNMLLKASCSMRMECN